jgi:hypothetical protein
MSTILWYRFERWLILNIKLLGCRGVGNNTMCAAASRTLAKFQTSFNPEIEKPLERSSLRAEYKPLAACASKVCGTWGVPDDCAVDAGFRFKKP